MYELSTVMYYIHVHFRIHQIYSLLLTFQIYFIYQHCSDNLKRKIKLCDEYGLVKDLPKDGQKRSHGSVIEPYKDEQWQGTNQIPQQDFGFN